MTDGDWHGGVKMIVMSGNNSKLDNISLIAGSIIFGFICILIIWLLIMRALSYHSYIYMKKQKETGADKKRVLDIRHRLNVNWQETGMHYFVNACKNVFLYLYMEGDCMQINVPLMLNSCGEEVSDNPLGIYQEQEVYRFINLLPLYSLYWGVGRCHINVPK